MIQHITWDDILHIWSTELWPNRTSAIESNSAMIFNQPGKYDIANMRTNPTFLGFVRNSHLLGVTSGHACADNSYRIRGTWVHESLRGTGVAHGLIEKIVKQGISENTDFAWTMPRMGASIKMFTKLGFHPVSDVYQTETGDNTYCRLNYTDFHIPDVRPVGIFN